MDIPPDEDLFFTTLLQSGGQQEDNTAFDSIHDNVFQTSQPEGEKRPPSKKLSRGVSFTVEEDNFLVSSWLNISIDIIHETDQKSTQIWERIDEYYFEYKKPSTHEQSVG